MIARNVTKGIAIAHRDDAIRLSVHEDLRNSPFAYQALPLVEYLRGQDGGVFARAVAAASHVTTQDFVKMISSLEGLTSRCPQSSIELTGPVMLRSKSQDAVCLRPI